MSKALIVKTKNALFDLGSQLNHAKQHDLPYWEQRAAVDSNDYVNFNLTATKEGITKLESEVAEIQELLDSLVSERNKHRANLEADIDKTQGDLHDLESELEDMECDGYYDIDEFRDLNNLIYHLKEFITTCEEALEDLDA